METEVQKFGNLKVERYPDRLKMGTSAAAFAAGLIRETLAARGKVNMMFAAAPSQNEFLEALVGTADLPWHRINAFHMDEYIGLEPSASQGFGNFLRRHLFDRVPLASVHLIDGQAADSRRECRRYALLLEAFPLDIVCLGIGENGHIAFNDPPTADFHDPAAVKVVGLDDACRRQQVNDGCFPAFSAVPESAFTVTVPALLSASRIVCVVPGERKAEAVRAAVLGPVSPACPASALRTHAAAVMFLDSESGRLLSPRLRADDV